MLVGSICALMGVLTIALPVPNSLSKLPKKRRRILQPHEIKPMVGKSTTAVLLGGLANKGVSPMHSSHATLSSPRQNAPQIKNTCSLPSNKASHIL
uniref:Uncharacterized protein n=1 Tax=Parascaris equorum TaxID=6256 RepID=A0A914R3Q6_PAREQ